MLMMVEGLLASYGGIIYMLYVSQLWWMFASVFRIIQIIQNNVYPLQDVERVACFICRWHWWMMFPWDRWHFATLMDVTFIYIYVSQLWWMFARNMFRPGDLPREHPHPSHKPPLQMGPSKTGSQFWFKPFPRQFLTKTRCCSFNPFPIKSFPRQVDNAPGAETGPEDYLASAAHINIRHRLSGRGEEHILWNIARGTAQRHNGTTDPEIDSVN